MLNQVYSLLERTLNYVAPSRAVTGCARFSSTLSASLRTRDSHVPFIPAAVVAEAVLSKLEMIQRCLLGRHWIVTFSFV